MATAAIKPKPTAEERKLRKHLKDLTTSVQNYLKMLDAEMKRPRAPVDRGKRIAELSNRLETVNDQARYFGLGVDWRKDKKST